MCIKWKKTRGLAAHAGQPTRTSKRVDSGGESSVFGATPLRRRLRHRRPVCSFSRGFRRRSAAPPFELPPDEGPGRSDGVRRAGPRHFLSPHAPALLRVEGNVSPCSSIFIIAEFYAISWNMLRFVKHLRLTYFTLVSIRCSKKSQSSYYGFLYENRCLRNSRHLFIVIEFDDFSIVLWRFILNTVVEFLWRSPAYSWLTKRQFFYCTRFRNQSIWS